VARPAGAVALPSGRIPRAAWRGVDVPAAGASLVLAGLLGVALLAEVLAPYGPREVAGPPLAAPGPRLPFGTDELGRDLWSLWLYGTRTSLLLGASVGLLSTAAAAGAGIFSAGTDVFARLVSALTELVAAIPVFLLLVLAVALTGPSLGALVLALSACGWAVFARVLRVQARGELRRDFVVASRALGATHAWVLRKHVLPQLAPLLCPAQLGLRARLRLQLPAAVRGGRVASLDRAAGPVGGAAHVELHRGGRAGATAGVGGSRSGPAQEP